MTRKNSDKTKLSTKIFSGLFFLVGLTILVLIGISLGKEAYRKKQIQKEIEDLQAQIDGLNQENGDMEKLIGYLSSSDFTEKEAREKLNLQKEDEKMIVLRKDAPQPESQSQNSNPASQPAPEDNSPNWQKWWDYFFGTKD
jgi:cell division protein FtsL